MVEKVNEMMTNYSDDDFLLLSGIQHMAFCERQGALIHSEQVWAETKCGLLKESIFINVWMTPFKDENRKTLRIVRSMPLVFQRLGAAGHSRCCGISSK
jgi:CRISPR-associated exonuclease Cas4